MIEINQDEVFYANTLLQPNSQQFATVVFDRGEDAKKCKMTIITDGGVFFKLGNNDFNPSLRRHSSCVYVVQEHQQEMTENIWEYENVVKICTIQHKGFTRIEIKPVYSHELNYLFKRY